MGLGIILNQQLQSELVEVQHDYMVCVSMGVGGREG